MVAMNVARVMVVREELKDNAADPNAAHDAIITQPPFGCKSDR
jgi:predicted RNA methylase